MAIQGPDDWTLPIPRSLFLETGELLLLDWIMCTASNLIPGIDLHGLVANYGDLRLRVWRAIEGTKVMPAEMTFDLEEMEQLLALVPTTFRWGTGPDVGYTLKLKLAQVMLGVPKP